MEGSSILDPGGPRELSSVAFLICWCQVLPYKINPVEGRGGSSKKSNIKMPKECPKWEDIPNMSIVKKPNSLTMDETDNFNC